jgi:hypothetical protein
MPARPSAVAVRRSPRRRAQRPAVEAEANHVGDGVDGAHALIGAIAVRPVGRTGSRRRQGREQSDGDEDVGSMLAALRRDEIED